MIRTTVVWMALLLLLCSLVAAQAYTEAEDLAQVQATVDGFSQDSGLSYITVTVDMIYSYQRDPNATYPVLEPNQTVTLGYLWGHRPVGNITGTIDIGSEINATIGYHFNFSSHTGHLYSYTLICGVNQTIIEGRCSPIECRSEEVRRGPDCIPLNCPSDSVASNHTCSKLVCESFEVASNHQCVVLECANNQAAVDHSCQELHCGLNSIIRDHACVPLVCGIFSRPEGRNCTFDWAQALVFILLFAAFLYFIYDLFVRGIFERGRRNQLLLGKPLTLFAFLVALVVVGLPIVFRLILHGNYLVGDVSYYHTEIARQMMSGQLSYSLLNEGISPFHLIVAAVGNFIGIENAARIIPLVLACLSACLFYIILRKIINDGRVAVLSTLILIFSPGFLYIAAFSTPDSMVIFLLLLGLLFSMSSKPFPISLAVLAFAFASLNSLFIYLLVGCLMLFLYFYLKNNRTLRLCLLGALLILGGVYHLIYMGQYNSLSGFRSDPIRASITDLGGIKGFGIFSFILIFVGIAVTWKDKKQYYPLYIALILFGIQEWLLNTNYNTYLNIVASYLIGMGLMGASNRKWEVRLLKNLTLLVILCGLLFSSISYAKRVSAMEPDDSIVTSLQWLSVLPQGRVLSYQGYSDFISYFGKKPALVPTVPRSDTAFLLNVSSEIFYSRSLVKTSMLLESQNITYILIDSNMRQGLVWSRDDEGLLYLLRNNETFRQIYNHDNTEIWEFLGSNSQTQ